MVDRLNKIRSRFDEIANARENLQLKESDGVLCPSNGILRPPTGHMVDEKSIFGRDADVTKVVDLLLSENEKSFSVISIIGEGGLGKTTIAQLVYYDARVRPCYDLFGWVSVSEDFDVGRMIKETIDSFTGKECDLSELSPLQEELVDVVKDNKILLVLDDVWNENHGLWELFRVPLSKAKGAHILVTTRNESVAEVMLSTASIKPDQLSEDSCWQLFLHYAFGDASFSVPAHFVEMGREITRKCGGIPLAVKSIANLLRHETHEEGWRQILESDLWESDPLIYIFPALQINYAHLPPYLKPCFLFCSMFPKDYEIPMDNLIELWISHGYIKSMGKKTSREVGAEYYEELRERSFIDVSFGQEQCKLHGIIHDLARLNSDKEHWSVEINQANDIQEVKIPEDVRHLYVRGFTGYVNQVLQQNLKGLRTLSTDLRGCREVSEHQYCINSTESTYLNLKLLEDNDDCWGNTVIFNLAKFEALRVLELKGNHLTLIPDSIAQLKHLCYLRIASDWLEMLPGSIYLLYNLQTFILDCWLSPLELPRSIGYLPSLRFLCIKCAKLKHLPKSLGSLTNLLRLVIKCDNLEMIPSDIGELCNLQELTIDARLDAAFLDSICCLSSLEELCMGRPSKLPDELGYCHKLKTLKISGCSVNYDTYLPKNFPAMRNMTACLEVRSIGWLKDMKDLEGELVIEGLQNTSNFVDAEHANLRSKCKIETLDICWHNNRTHMHFDGLAMVLQKKLTIKIIQEAGKGVPIGGGTDTDVGLLQFLQPHPHLKRLVLEGYPSAMAPGWMGDPSSLQAIHEIRLISCHDLQSLPFSDLRTIKHLQVHKCLGFRLLPLEQLHSQLEELKISWCEKVESITGLRNQKMLARLEITDCRALKSITMDKHELQLVDSIEPFHGQSTSALKELVIQNCPLLHALPHELVQSGPCNVSVRGCNCPDLYLRNPSVRP
jgi:NB-ARC domain